VALPVDEKQIVANLVKYGPVAGESQALMSHALRSKPHEAWNMKTGGLTSLVPSPHFQSL